MKKIEGFNLKGSTNNIVQLSAIWCQQKQLMAASMLERLTSCKSLTCRMTMSPAFTSTSSMHSQRVLSCFSVKLWNKKLPCIACLIWAWESTAPTKAVEPHSCVHSKFNRESQHWNWSSQAWAAEYRTTIWSVLKLHIKKKECISKEGLSLMLYPSFRCEYKIALDIGCKLPHLQESLSEDFGGAPKVHLAPKKPQLLVNEPLIAHGKELDHISMPPALCAMET